MGSNKWVEICPNCKKNGLVLDAGRTRVRRLKSWFKAFLNVRFADAGNSGSEFFSGPRAGTCQECGFRKTG